MKIDEIAYNFEERFQALLTEAKESWPGAGGLEREQELKSFLNTRLEEYSKILNITKEQLLLSWEQLRNCSALSYYQQCNLPAIDTVLIFENKGAFLKKFPSQKYVCPSCEDLSTNPFECNSGRLIFLSNKKDKQPCNWKSYGLFQDMGKGIRVLFKNTFVKDYKVYLLFKPLELYQDEFLKQRGLLVSVEVISEILEKYPYLNTSGNGLKAFKTSASEQAVLLKENRAFFYTEQGMNEISTCISFISILGIRKIKYCSSIGAAIFALIVEDTTLAERFSNKKISVGSFIIAALIKGFDMNDLFYPSFNMRKKDYISYYAPYIKEKYILKKEESCMYV